MQDTLEISSPVAVSASEIKELTAFACTVVKDAGRTTLPFFRTGMELQNKDQAGDFDPVTEADRECESSMRSAITARYPEHGLFGEEFGLQSGNGLTWVMDPIDGTRSFVSGFLHWGVLLALFNGSEPILGVMHQPYTQELFVGDGKLARFQSIDASTQLKTRACENLTKATLATTDPALFLPGTELRGFDAVQEQARLIRYGGDCYQYVMLAAGHVDVVVETQLKPWDIQALMPIIQGAGGVITDWSGENAAMGGRAVASGDKRVHQETLRLLQAQSNY